MALPPEYRSTGIIWHLAYLACTSYDKFLQMIKWINGLAILSGVLAQMSNRLPFRYCADGVPQYQ